jgi:hypothetical protein
MSDGSRERAKGGKPGQMNEVKEGAFVMVLGHVNDKEVLRATRIDLRLLRQRFSRFNGSGPSVDARRSKFYACRGGLRTANHFLPRRETLGLRGYCFEAQFCGARCLP